MTGYAMAGRYHPPMTETQKIWSKWITIFGFKIPIGRRKRKITPGSKTVPRIASLEARHAANMREVERMLRNSESRPFPSLDDQAGWAREFGESVDRLWDNHTASKKGTNGKGPL
jgi:hypothetical protein